MIKLEGVKGRVHFQDVLLTEDCRDSLADFQDVRLGHRVQRVFKHFMLQVQREDDENCWNYRDEAAECQYSFHTVHVAPL